MRSYSYSAINEYENCPLKYKFKRIDKFSEPQSVALATGIAVHDWTSEYTAVCRDNKHSTYYDFLERITPPADPVVAEDALEIIQRYIESHVYDWSLISELKTEFPSSYDKDWNPCEWNDENAWFRLKIDQEHLENDLLVVTDFKTNRAIDFTQKAFEEKPLNQIFQLAVYVYDAYLRHPEIERFLIRFDYVRYGMGGIRRRKVARDEIEGVRDLIEQKIKVIEKDETFDPRLSSFCDYCGFTAKCPEIQKALEDSGDSMIFCADDAQEMAERVKAMQVATKLYTTKLKAWIDQNHHLTVGNEDLGFHVSNVTTYKSPLILKKVLGCVDEDALYGAIAFSKSSLKTLWSALGLKEQMKQKEFLEMLDPFKTETSKTSFNFQKIKE